MIECKLRKVFKTCPDLGLVWFLILATAFILPNTPALEVMEQCSLNSGPNQKLATVRGTISYQVRLVNVPPDFWKDGVGTSKRIINKILKKITSYEDNMNKNFDDEIQEKIVDRFKKISDENLWFDEQKQKPVDKEAFCATVDEMKTKERKVLTYTCSESEQLYGIGYHKVYEDCKDDKFLAQFNVDWSICLHAHYPWVDMTHWSVCVIKSYKNDFLACFCLEEDGKLEKRSFCITKFECFLHGQGLNNQNTALVVTDQCKNSIQYFMEVNVKSKKSFKKAQQIDKLRVRALYHPESPCKDHQFSAQFDVGQLDTENLNSGIEVHTPKLVEYRMIPDDPAEPMQCGMPYDDEPEEKIDPVVRQRHRMLDDIFKERMVAAAVIWIPGIFFLYSYLSNEKSNLQIIFVQLVQYKVITLGLYNTAMSPILWRSTLFSKAEIGNAEITFLLISFLFTIIWLNQKEIAEMFLFYSVAYSIVSLVLANVTTKLRGRESLNLMGILAFLFYTGFAMLIGYKVSKILRAIRRRNFVRNNVIETIRNKDKYKKKNGKRRKSEQKPESVEKETQPLERTPSKHKMEKSIICSWKCYNTDSTGYVSLNCSERCSFLYHIQCWELFLAVKEVTEERHILLTPCDKKNCLGEFIKIFCFNKFGVKVRSTVSKNKTKMNLIKKRRNTTKAVKEKDVGKNMFEPCDTINHNTEPQPGNQFIENDNTNEDNLEINSILLSGIDFEKLYEIERENDQPYYLNEGFDNESVRMNTFGTIGEERKAKIIVQDLFEDEELFEEQDMFEELLGNTNIDYSDTVIFPLQSKFLSMIKKNNTEEEKIEDSQAESSNGFTFSLERINAESTSLTYCPNLKTKKKSEKNDDLKLDTHSLSYLSGTPGSWMMEEGIVNGVPLLGIEEEDREEEIDNKTICEDSHDDIFNTFCPFTKIIQKYASNYSVSQIEAAVQEVMIEVDPSMTTIPHFQHLVIEKLDTEAEAVYISDEDEEVDECLICTEFLETDLMSLEPCEHVFHLDCIKQWLEKDSSCPKCRAIVNKIK